MNQEFWEGGWGGGLRPCHCNSRRQIQGQKGGGSAAQLALEARQVEAEGLQSMKMVMLMKIPNVEFS